MMAATISTAMMIAATKPPAPNSRNMIAPSATIMTAPRANRAIAHPAITTIVRLANRIAANRVTVRPVTRMAATSIAVRTNRAKAVKIAASVATVRAANAPCSPTVRSWQKMKPARR